MAKIRLYYSGAIAFILSRLRYINFVFMVVYKEAQFLNHHVFLTVNMKMSAPQIGVLTWKICKV